MARTKQTQEEKLAALLGIGSPEIEEEIQEARTEEAMLAYLENPDLFTRIFCKRCKKKFAVNRRNVAYCSSGCRLGQLEEQFGIKRTNFKKNPRGDSDEVWVREAWGGNEPLVVPPQALSVLLTHEHDAEQSGNHEID